MSNPVFQPQLLSCMRGYTRHHFMRDLLAGLTVGAVALPLALAIGIASIPEDAAREAGVSPPVMGLLTAIVAGFLVSALGGSRVNIGGPTGAFVVIIYSVAATHGYAGLTLATLMAGVILIVMGLTRMGAMIKYIPYPVTTGFTSGIAVIIFTGQIKDFLGLEMGQLPPGFVGKMQAYGEHIATARWESLALGLGTIALITLWPRFVTRRIPSPIVALVLATLAAQWLGLGVDTIGSRFGEITRQLPTFRLPALDLAQAPDLVGAAITIAILAGIESLLCAVVADGMLGTRHRSNTELIAQGAANIASPLFGGIAATGAIARTATNVQSGGRTPIAGIVHALTLLAVLVALAPYASLIPLASLAGVLIVVAWNMSEIKRFRWLLNGPRSDAAVLIATFSLTVLIDLTVAVQVGMVLAAVLFIKRMADVTNVGSIRRDMQDGGDGADNAQRAIDTPPGVEVYQINGPFFFGAAYKLRDVLDAIGAPPKVLVLEMENVNAMDATGLHALEELRRLSERDKTRVVLAGVHAQPLDAMVRSGVLDKFGLENLCGTLPEAMARARALLDEPGAGAPRPPGA